MGEAALTVLGSVGLSGESNESIFVDVDCQWLKACHEHVQAQVIFESAYQVRLHNVLIDYIWPFLRQAAVFAQNLDTSTAGTCCGFEDPKHLSLVLIAFFLEDA